MAGVRVWFGSFCMLALAGCITAPAEAPPAWFTERENADAGSFPSLQSVPTGHRANTDASYWTRHEQELLTAAQAVKANPRGVWTAPDDPVAFMTEARAALDATRASHE